MPPLGFTRLWKQPKNNQRNETETRSSFNDNVHFIKAKNDKSQFQSCVYQEKWFAFFIVLDRAVSFFL